MGNQVDGMSDGDASKKGLRSPILGSRSSLNATAAPPMLLSPEKKDKDFQLELVKKLEHLHTKKTESVDLSSPKATDLDSSDASKDDASVAKHKARSTRRRTLKKDDVLQVRENITKFTATLDFWKQLEIVTGRETRRTVASREEAMSLHEHVEDEEDDDDEGEESTSNTNAIASQSTTTTATSAVTATSSVASPSLSSQDTTSEHKLPELVPSLSDASMTSIETDDDLIPVGATPISAGHNQLPSKDEVSDAEERRKQKKKLVIEETLASEQLYSQFLQLLCEKYIKPLRESNIVVEDDLERIFCNIEKIMPYHKVIAEELAHGEVASVFRKYAGYLKVYTKYVNNYDNACVRVAALKKNAQFQEFLNQRRRDPSCGGGLDLMSFLIMPIQRIPRYRLLLEELKRFTRETDEDRNLIDEALVEINHIANYVNEAKREAESRSKIVEIQNWMSGEFDNLLSPGRHLIHDGPLKLKKKSSRPTHVYLFNDLLLWVTPEMEFLGVTPLATAVLDQYQHKTKFGFKIRAAAFSEDLVFICRSRNELTLWTNMVSSALKDVKLPVMLSRRRAHSRRSKKLSAVPINDS